MLNVADDRIVDSGLLADDSWRGAGQGSKEQSKIVPDGFGVEAR